MDHDGHPELLTLEQFARFVQKTVPAVRALIRRGEVPDACYLKLGHQLRFRTAEVYRWLGLKTMGARAA